MSKKYTIEMVREEFEKHGYELLDDIYVGCDYKLKYRCPVHPDKELFVSFTCLKRGNGCKYCAFQKSRENIRLPFYKIEEEFIKRNLELIDDEYINNRTPLRYKCPNHPDKELSITFGHLQEGKGCPYCGGKMKHTLEEAKDMFSKYNYELLETEYINVSIPMKYKCPNHPDKEMYASYSHIKEGYGCTYCAGTNKPTIEEVRQIFKEHGYELKDTEYINSGTPMVYKCPKHPDKQTQISLSNLKNNRYGCPYCAGNKKKTYDEVRQIFKEYGYELKDTEYINSKYKMEYICPKHPDKKLSTSYEALNAGRGCRYCSYENKLGELNNNWNGGTTQLSEYLRRFIGEWKQECLQKYNFRCAITNSKYDLHVHHNKLFYCIRNEVLKILNMPLLPIVTDYTQEQLDLITTEFIAQHNKVEGIPLNKDIHRLFHKLYGNKCTSEDFVEFKQRWGNGEFENYVIELGLI